MRTTRVLAIIAIFGIAFSFRASANVVYDSETTNEWFSVDMSKLTTEALKSSPWTPPSPDGEAVVDGAVIKLDTDLGNPLTYTAGSSEDVAIVAAEMTATVNASEPDLNTAPQAALCVIGTETATNWVGLVGADNEAGYRWETFETPVPVAGTTYSIRIEFDQRQGAPRQIRYRVGGTVLGSGWYPNPQKTVEANIKSVSFSGTGDISGLGGSNVVENAIAFNALKETDGFDFTNGAISVSAVIQGYTGVTAELKLVDFATGDESTIGTEQSLADGASWDLSALTAGGTYGYTIVAKDVGGKVIATKTGTFTAANWGDVWFGADASKPTEDRVKGGKWEKEPTIENNAYYVIEDDSVFNVTKQEQGSNRVTRVDAKVTFESLVDGEVDMPEVGAIGGFVATTAGWKALTATEWVLLTGGPAPVASKPYVVRAEVDFISQTKRVRYLVSEDDGETFIPLSNGTAQWIDLAVQGKGLLAAVELQGSGKVAKFEATVADKALAEVGGVEYDTMEEAFAAAGTEGTNTIKLLTNATVDPKNPGSYDIAPNNYHYVSGGKVSTDTTNTKTIVIDPSGEPVVRPSTEEMNKVLTPDKVKYKDINKLRAFLEKNGVTAYTKDDATADGITAALKETPQNANGLALWQDYALGIDKTDSVAPVTTPTGDKDEKNITLSIPAIKPDNYSGDYTISYQINGEEIQEGAPQAILLPLKTANYEIKAVFTPKTESEQTESGSL